ncbi:MAG: hypothetical protein Q8L24_01315 [bacterium]|nr:hypothetical protein [bacterium]
MKRFKLIFKTYVIDSKGKVVWAKGITRVIAAQDHSLAARIAQAMKGEMINLQEYLDDATVVEPTGEDYAMVSCDSRTTWQRVLKNMKLQEKNVEWILGDKNRHEVVGMKIKTK